MKKIEKEFGGRLPVLQYNTAPHMFVLIGDTRAFVEQYSYGKLPDEPIGPPEDRILGTDLPLVEYRKDLDDVYTGVIDDLKQKEDPEYQQLRPQPYPLLESHFRYAWLMAKSTRTADLSPAGGGASLTDGSGSSARGD